MLSVVAFITLWVLSPLKKIANPDGESETDGAPRREGEVKEAQPPASALDE